MVILRVGMYNGIMRINTSKIKATLRLTFVRAVMLALTPLLLVLLLGTAVSWILLSFTITALFLSLSFLLNLFRTPKTLTDQLKTLLVSQKK
jgi:hypothetical protein